MLKRIAFCICAFLGSLTICKMFTALSAVVYVVRGFDITWAYIISAVVAFGVWKSTKG